MPSPRSLTTACWILRFVVALQCVGLAVILLLGTYETEADIYGLLYFDLEWPEAAALAVEDAGTWAYLAAGLLVVPLGAVSAVAGTKSRFVAAGSLWLQILCLVWVAAWHMIVSGLHAWRGGAFMVEWAVGAHAVRIFVPLALIMLLLAQSREQASRYTSLGQWILRLATAATFAVHGLEAIRLNPSFVDLLIGSADHLLGIAVSESTTTPVLITIGVVDLVLAALIVAIRSKTLAAYMSFWGIATACSRMTAAGLAGLALAYPETLIRAANGGAPLALLVLWYGYSAVTIQATKKAPTPSRQPEEPVHASV